MKKLPRQLIKRDRIQAALQLDVPAAIAALCLLNPPQFPSNDEAIAFVAITLAGVFTRGVSSARECNFSVFCQTYLGLQNPTDRAFQSALLDGLAWEIEAWKRQFTQLA